MIFRFLKADTIGSCKSNAEISRALGEAKRRDSNLILNSLVSQTKLKLSFFAGVCELSTVESDAIATVLL